VVQEIQSASTEINLVVKGGGLPVDGSNESVMARRVMEFCRGEEGQDLVEYSLLMAFIAMMALGLAIGLQGSLANLLVSITQKLSNAVVQLSAS